MERSELPLDVPFHHIRGDVSPLNFERVYRETDGRMFALLDKSQIAVYVDKEHIYMEPGEKGTYLQAELEPVARVSVEEGRHLVIFDLQTEYEPSDSRFGTRREGFPGGADFMLNAVRWFRQHHNISGIKFAWSPGSINHAQMIKALEKNYQQGITSDLSQLARDETWTGKTVQRLFPEFDQIEMGPKFEDDVMLFEGIFSNSKDQPPTNP